MADWPEPGIWMPFTPELFTVSDDDIPGEAVQPNLGSAGTKFGRFRIANGLAVYRGRLQFAGTGQSAGVGNYNIVLPSPGIVTDGADVLGGNIYIYSTAGATHADAKVRFVLPVGFTSVLITLFLETESRGNFHHVRHNNPWDWATNGPNFIRFWIEGEAA